MEHKFEKYFTFLKPTGELAADFIAYLVGKDINDAEYVFNLDPNLFPDGVKQNSEFINALGEGALLGIEKNSDSSIAENYFAMRAIEPLLKALQNEYADKNIDYYITHLQDVVDLNTQIDIPSICSNIRNDTVCENLQRVSNMSLNIVLTDEGDFIHSFDILSVIRQALETTSVSTKVQKSVNRLLNTLKSLYKPLWNHKYVSILHREGSSISLVLSEEQQKVFKGRGVVIDVPLINEVLISWYATFNGNQSDISPFSDKKLYFL